MEEEEEEEEEEENVKKKIISIQQIVLYLHEKNNVTANNSIQLQFFVAMDSLGFFGILERLCSAALKNVL